MSMKMFKQEHLTFKDWLNKNECKFLYCSDAISNWVGERNLEQVWLECTRGDWLLRIAQLTGISDYWLMQAAFKCVQRIEHLHPADPAIVKACCAEIETQLSLGEFCSYKSKMEDGSLQINKRVMHDAAVEIYSAVNIYSKARYAELVDGVPAAAAAKAAFAVANLCSFDYEAAVYNVAVAVETATSSIAARYLEERACAHIVRKIIPFEVISEVFAVNINGPA
ncbi:MAG: hypothetical protein GY861_02595 [bacterium]|nr:hypothetical protein [bacterium]